MSLHVFAGLRVRDFQAARPWYERLLGEPTFLPHATEAVWTLAEDGSVYVVEHADGAGNSVVTVMHDDLDAQVAAIAARGLEPDERLTYSNGVRKVLYRNPAATNWNSAARRSTPVHSGPVRVTRARPRGVRSRRGESGTAARSGCLARERELEGNDCGNADHDNGRADARLVG